MTGERRPEGTQPARTSSSAGVDGCAGSPPKRPRASAPRADSEHSLDRTLQELIDQVDQRVRAAHNVYLGERDEVRLAARQVQALRASLGLGRFLGPVGGPTGKPQFRLLFEPTPQDEPAPQGQPVPSEAVVLKVYGRRRPGEARVQQLWKQHAVRVVDVLDAGDDPTSWLLMRHLQLAPLTRGTLSGQELTAVTGELAAVLRPAHAAGSTALAAGRVAAGLQRLDDAIHFHLGSVLTALQRHGYPVRPDWQDLTRQLCNGNKRTLLHGDLAVGNVVRDIADGQLRVLDTCGYLGPPEFDLARWAARTGGPAESEEVLAAWLNCQPELDAARARALLGLELLMEAGVREIIKLEKRLPSGFPDSTTTELLTSADRFLDDAAARS